MSAKKKLCLLAIILLGIVHLVYCVTVITLGLTLLKHQDLLINTNSAVLEFKEKVINQNGLIDHLNKVLDLGSKELDNIDIEIKNINSEINQINIYGNYSVNILYHICLSLQSILKVNCPIPPKIIYQGAPLGETIK